MSGSLADLAPKLAATRSWGAKRAVDLIGAAAALGFAAPVMLGIAAAIRMSIGRPVLFRQRRPGLEGQPFVLFKFRTMTADRDESGEILPDADRLLPLGAFLRATSLDELPELFNVLIGDMSLVGPRPLLMEYLERYSDEQARRHDVKPGITGWAQVNGRNAISWDEKFDLDLWYVDNWSVATDLLILLRTVLIVLRREGIGHDGDATMPVFMGSGSLQ